MRTPRRLLERPPCAGWGAPSAAGPRAQRAGQGLDAPASASARRRKAGVGAGPGVVVSDGATAQAHVRRREGCECACLGSGVHRALRGGLRRTPPRWHAGDPRGHRSSNPLLATDLAEAVAVIQRTLRLSRSRWLTTAATRHADPPATTTFLFVACASTVRVPAPVRRYGARAPSASPFRTRGRRLESR